MQNAHHLQGRKHVVLTHSEWTWLFFSPPSYCLAILNDQYDLATLLLRYNASADQTGPLDRTALHECSFLGLENFVYLLLESGANPNACDIKKKTPLALAAQNGHLNVVEVLLQKGTCGFALLIDLKQLAFRLFTVGKRSWNDSFCRSPCVVWIRVRHCLVWCSSIRKPWRNLLTAGPWSRSKHTSLQWTPANSPRGLPWTQAVRNIPVTAFLLFN